MTNNAETDSISISALILSHLAITGTERFYIWFINCNRKETVSVLFEKER